MAVLMRTRLFNTGLDAALALGDGGRVNVDQDNAASGPSRDFGDAGTHEPGPQDSN